MNGQLICRKPSCATRCCDCVRAAEKRAATQERSAPPLQRRARAEVE